MMKKWLIAAVAVLCAAGRISAAEPVESHRAAALAYLEAKGTPRLLERNCRLMLEKQLAAAPEYASHRAELEKFYLGTFGFPALKEDLIKLYTAEYSEAELRELAAFYSTPLGKKTVSVEEKLVPAFAAILESKAAASVEAARKK